MIGLGYQIRIYRIYLLNSIKLSLAVSENIGGIDPPPPPLIYLCCVARSKNTTAEGAERKKTFSGQKKDDDSWTSYDVL